MSKSCPSLGLSLPSSFLPLLPQAVFTGHQDGENTHLEVTQYQCKGGIKTALMC